MTEPEASIVVVNDASCLIDLRKARLLHLLIRLPYRLVIPLPVRASELIRFTEQEWAVLDAGVTVFDLPPERVSEAFAIKASFPKLSSNDCFCLVTTRCHDGAILLTGDQLLRSVASDDGRRVHGVLWVIDELKRLMLCDDDILVTALELWRDDPTVRLPSQEIARRLRQMGRI
ncbi:type II toxin-antitoxin system VapC family toxin [Cereibacter sphaeroides]|uniref:type II toxin-antitoxin system VapC family toxin n=1 Tax=Cereibacter sphaeroides TaxID=1063 RepID=UPI001F461CD7|nr:type II toxin-antitoxin system VapC family toxin [Cereibacter sphaeroides]MCE6957972.1 type II toxin-antitoxin system VapC family toxin [Cereibacter sphaeroides]MCE6971779.1 type II toxin-antitoxin system VapC family toxin [Cereibacter sphaeroides]